MANFSFPVYAGDVAVRIYIQIAGRDKDVHVLVLGSDNIGTVGNLQKGIVIDDSVSAFVKGDPLIFSAFHGCGQVRVKFQIFRSRWFGRAVTSSRATGTAGLAWGSIRSRAATEVRIKGSFDFFRHDNSFHDEIYAPFCYLLSDLYSGRKDLYIGCIEVKPQALSGSKSGILSHVKFVVLPFLREKFLMLSTLNNASVIYHNDYVCIPNRGQAMGNHDACSVLHD